LRYLGLVEVDDPSRREDAVPDKSGGKSSTVPPVVTDFIGLDHGGSDLTEVLRGDGRGADAVYQKLT
jgi:hypothetical protein